jgi:hypothetical protein
MSSDARMIGAYGSSAKEIDLDRGWIVSMTKMGFGQRTADVGEPILTKVAVLSDFEAKKVNESYRIAIEADLKASEADPKKTESAKVFVRDWYRSELECVARVDELLAAIGKVAYFSPWVIVEEANID